MVWANFFFGGGRRGEFRYNEWKDPKHVKLTSISWIFGRHEHIGSIYRSDNASRGIKYLRIRIP